MCRNGFLWTPRLRTYNNITEEKIGEKKNPNIFPFWDRFLPGYDLACQQLAWENFSSKLRLGRSRVHQKEKNYISISWMHGVTDSGIACRETKFKRALRLHFLSDFTRIFSRCLTTKL